MGALAPLFQATDLSARSSRYVVGAKWPKPPGLAVESFPARARDPSVAAKLWHVSETLTGVRYL